MKLPSTIPVRPGSRTCVPFPRVAGALRDSSTLPEWLGLPSNAADIRQRRGSARRTSCRSLFLVGRFNEARPPRLAPAMSPRSSKLFRALKTSRPLGTGRSLPKELQGTPGAGGLIEVVEMVFIESLADRILRAKPAPTQERIHGSISAACSAHNSHFPQSSPCMGNYILDSLVM